MYSLRAEVAIAVGRVASLPRTARVYDAPAGPDGRATRHRMATQNHRMCLCSGEFRRSIECNAETL